MDNLNDPYCREFIEAMAAILVQQVQQMPDEQPVLAVMPGYPIRTLQLEDYPSDGYSGSKRGTSLLS